MIFIAAAKSVRMWEVSMIGDGDVYESVEIVVLLSTRYRSCGEPVFSIMMIFSRLTENSKIEN